MQNIPPGIRESLEEFRRRYPDPRKVAFAIMRFRSDPRHEEIYERVASLLKHNGIELLRADAHPFNSSLLHNIETYMHGCGFGVAIYTYDRDDKYNPNVSLEVGYMLGLGKPVIHLKDGDLRDLHSDLLGQIFVEFQHGDINEHLDQEIRKWLDARCLGKANKTYHLLFPNGIKISGDLLEHLENGLSQMCRPEDFKFLGVVEGRGGDMLSICVKADSVFGRNAADLIDRGVLQSTTGVPFEKIEEEGADPQQDQHDPARGSNIKLLRTLEEGQFTKIAHICKRKYYDGYEWLGDRADSLLPGNTNKPEEVAIFVSKAGDGIYLHSNYVNAFQGMIERTKVIIPELTNLACALPSILETPIEHHGHYYFDVRLNDSLLSNHMRDVLYIFDGQHFSASNLLDTLGAFNVEVCAV